MAHINKNGKPLCNQSGEFFELKTQKEFERIPFDERCLRCEKILGIMQKLPCENPLSGLGRNQEALLFAISKRTQGEKQWFFVADFCTNKTKKSGWNLLDKTIRSLQYRGLIEKKREHNRALIRLADNVVVSESGRCLTTNGMTIRKGR